MYVAIRKRRLVSAMANKLKTVVVRMCVLVLLGEEKFELKRKKGKFNGEAYSCL